MSANTISLTFKVEDVAGGFKKIVTNAESLKTIMGASVTEAQKLTADLSRAASAVKIFDAVSGAIGQLQSSMRGLTDAYSVQIQAETQLQTVMRERMNATDSDIQAIKDLCSAQQQLGVIGDEVQLAGAQTLASFVSQRSTLETLIPVMNNVAAAQAGLNATSGNAVNAATLLGKAMAGNLTHLQRMGIYLSDGQKEIMTLGTESQRAAVLVEVLTKKYGEQNAELAKTPAGKLKQQANEIGDMAEKIGGWLQPVAPFVNQLAAVTIAASGFFRLVAAIKGAVIALKSFHLVTKVCNLVLKATGISAQAAAIKTDTFANAVGGSISVCRKATIAINVTRVALYSLFAMGGAWAIMTMGASLFGGASQDATEKIKELTASEKALADQTERQKSIQTESETTLAKTRTELDLNIKKIKEFNGSKEQERKMVEDLNNTYGTTMGYFSTLSDWYKTLTSNSEAYCRQMVNEIELRQKAESLATGKAQYKDLTGRDFEGLKSVRHYTEALENAKKKRSDLIARRAEMMNEYKSTQNYVEVSPGHSSRSPGEEFAAMGFDKIDRDIRVYDIVIKRLTQKRDYARKLVEEEGELFGKANESKSIQMNVKGSDKPIPNTQNPSGGSANSAPVFREDATILKDIEENIRYYQELQKYANASTAAEINDSRKYWEGLRDEIVNAGTAVDKFIEKPECIADFENNIRILTEQLRQAKSEADATTINQKIAEQQAGADKLRNAGVPNTGAAPTALIEDASTLGDIENNIKYYQEQLNGATVDTAASINANIAKWQEMADAIRAAGIETGDTMDKTEMAADAIGKVGQSVGSLGKALELPALDIVGTMAQAIATMILGYANASKDASGLGPFGWIAFAATGLGVLATMISQVKSFGAFADGGIVSGPTLGLVGEYAGASHNPEVIAPLNKLKTLIEPRDSGMGGRVEFEIDGRKLYGVLQRVNNVSNRS